MTFISCDDKKKNIDDKNLTDIINKDQQPKNEIKTIEVNKENKTLEVVDSDYKIFPIDESGSDSTLVEFITKLKKIVSNKDTVELFKSLDTSIIVSYGGGIYGIKEFSKNWALDKPGNSELWKILNKILNLGGTWESDEGKYFCIPYAQSSKAFSKYKYDFNWYFTAVCISPKVSVYKEPKTTSSELGTLNYDIVEIDPDSRKTDFAKIHTIDKKVQGYVRTSELIYSADQHLMIKKIAGNWKITAFAPFD